VLWLEGLWLDELAELNELELELELELVLEVELELLLYDVSELSDDLDDAVLRLERDCELSEDGVLDDWLVAVEAVDADDSELGVSDDLELDEDELELGVRELSELGEDNEDETVTVTSYFAGLVMDAQGNRNTNALTPANTPVTFSQARFCYVLVINRDSNSGYPAGKMVTLRDNGFTLSDQQSGTKQITYPLLDLLPMGGIPTGPQRHLNDSPGVIGGGYSFATPLPTDYPTMVTLNLQDLFRTAPNQ